MSTMVAIEKQQPEKELSQVAEGSEYPWGTSLQLEGTLVDQLGIGDLSPGDQVQLKAVAVVQMRKEGREFEDNSIESEKCVKLQLTSISVDNPKNSQSDRIKNLYGED